MSQVNLGGQQPQVNLDANGPQAQGPGPRPDLPQALQNARPARGSILARVGAFLARKFTPGGLAAGLIGGGVLAAGIATGGAGLLGGGAVLLLYAGIKAIFNHFRRAPDPEPRLQNLPENNLPQAEPQADAYNNQIADAIENGGILPESLKNAAENAVSQMRAIYGEALMPQGTPLRTLVGGGVKLAHAIRTLEGNVTPAKIGELVEAHIRENMASNALDNAFKPLCGDDTFLPRIMSNNAAKKHPDMLEALKNTTSRDEVQGILNGHAEEFREMVSLYQRAKALHEGTRAQAISTIARSLGLDTDFVATLVKPNDFTNRMRELTYKVVRGEVAADAIEQEFSKLADALAKPYVDSLAAVNADETLSAATKNAMKMEILRFPDSPTPELYSKGIAAGKKVDVTALKNALDGNMPADTVHNLLLDLGEQLDVALKNEYGEEAWNALKGGKPDNLRKTQGAAFLAMLDKEPGLMDALRARQDLDVYSVMNSMLVDENAPPARRAASQTAYAGYVRLVEFPLANADFVKMEKQTQSLSAIRNAGAGVAQELKDRWTGMVMSGEIAEPAMVQALIENAGNPGLPAETRSLVERFILHQSYAPGDAAASTQKARAFAQEASRWRNFNTAEDPAMAPVTTWIKDDITQNLYNGQVYTRGISDQLELDAPRGVYTINGQVMNHADANEVTSSLRRAMPTEEAAKLVSSIINQRSFGPLNGLGMQMHPTTAEALPNDVLNGMTKMASRNIQATGSMLHFDLGTRNQADLDYKVTVRNGKAFIEMSENVGLDSGLGTDEHGAARLAGMARYTLRFECDLLGNDGKSPSILNVSLEQRLLPLPE